MSAEMERLLKKAQVALDRYSCFKCQIERFGEAGAKAEVPPERDAKAGTGQEPASVEAAARTAAGIDDPPDPSPNLFARLPDGRYRIAYDGKEDTVPGLAGLRVVEYLLKQPGKARTFWKSTGRSPKGNRRRLPLKMLSPAPRNRKG